jgi:hypothetical protein
MYLFDFFLLHILILRNCHGVSNCFSNAYLYMFFLFFVFFFCIKKLIQEEKENSFISPFAITPYYHID